MRFIPIGLMLVVSLLPTVVFGALNIDGFTTLEHDRFANDATFIADDYDLSGIAVNESGRWVTMISENVFITATHYAPASGSSVTFYASNDPDGYTSTRTVTSNFQQIGSTDLYLGTLSAALDSNFTFYDFATENISSAPGGPDSFSSSIYNDADAFVFGRSETAFSVSQDIAVGANKLDTFYTGVTVSPSTGDVVISTIDSLGDTNYLTSEAALQGGDSGAPLMVQSGVGELTIVGINWFVGTADGDDINGHTYVGNYDATIQSFIDANPVPEPATYALLTGVLATMATFVQRRRA